MKKRVTFNTKLNKTKIITRIPKKDIVGSYGVDNWSHFALIRCYEEKIRREKNQRKEITIKRNETIIKINTSGKLRNKFNESTDWTLKIINYLLFFFLLFILIIYLYS